MPEPASMQVNGNVNGSIVVGDHNFVVNTNHGTIVYQQAPPQVRPQPNIPQALRPLTGFINRTTELTRLESAIRAGEVVLLHGADGMGKSALLQQAASSTAAKTMPNGVITLESVDLNGQTLGANDIIQQLFDALFESNPPLKVNEITARTHLSNTRPLIVLDEVSLSPALQKALPNLFPQGAMLIAADGTGGMNFERLAIGPLPPAEALALLSSKAELTLNNTNRAALEKICEQLGNVPLALVVTGNILRETRTSPEAALLSMQAIAAPERDPARAALNRAFGFAFGLLRPEEKQALSAAALTPGVSMSPAWLSAALGSVSLETFLAHLKALGLLNEKDSRLSLPPGFIAPAQSTSVLSKETVMPRLIAWLRAPLQTNGQNAGHIQAELGSFFGALAWAAQTGRSADVIALGRALDPYLTLHGLWDAWGNVTGYVLDAARLSGEKAVESWALHQLGTRAIGLEMKPQALDLLRQALEIRRTLGDTIGMAHTQHNINFLTLPPMPPRNNPPKSQPPKPNAGGPNWFLVIGGIIVLGLMALLLIGGVLLLPIIISTPAPTVTTINTPLPGDTLAPPTDEPTLEILPTETAIPTESPTLPPTLTPTATFTPTPLGGGAGELVFHYGDDNPYSIQRIFTDGSKLIPVIAYAESPAWSPDGQSIAFAAPPTSFSPPQVENGVQIYVLNIVSGKTRLITNTSGDKSQPAWSPDGRQIVFVRFDGDFNRDLYIVDAAGGEPQLLTDTPNINEDNPAWSPDGGQILYDANFNESYRQLGLVNADGSSNQLLSNPGLLLRRDMIEPRWSPDGRQIAFSAKPLDSDSYDIYVMNPNGTKLRHLLSEKFTVSNEHTPAWSPDGRWLSFTSNLNGPRQIFIIQLDGSGVQPIITSDAAAWEPDWRP